MIKQTRKPIQLTKSMLINILRDMVCSLPRLRPETISMVVIILSPSHPLRVRKYLVVQNQNWNQYSTYTFLPWIISNMRI